MVNCAVVVHERHHLFWVNSEWMAGWRLVHLGAEACLYNVRICRMVLRGRTGDNSMTSDLRVGAVFPQTEIGTSRNDIHEWIAGVRDAGFQHMVAYDHVLSGEQAHHHPKLVGRYDETKPFHEVMVLFGYMAAIAPELEAVSGVVILPQRQTALVAKQAATVDLLTGGRFRLGVGIGWNDIEYQGLNESFGNRGRRIEEQIDLLRALWQAPIISYEGTWHTIDHAGLAPLPVQRPIPIWIGGSADIALQRAARLADGFFSNSGIDLERSAHEVGVIAAELERIDRDPASFGWEPRLNLSDNDPDAWRRAVDWWRDHGATHLSINTMGAGCQSVTEHLAGLEQVRQAIADI
jgi:probable F420-dependent oxidoreductase